MCVFRVLSIIIHTIKMTTSDPAGPQQMCACVLNVVVSPINVCKDLTTLKIMNKEKKQIFINSDNESIPEYTAVKVDNYLQSVEMAACHECF